MMHGKTALITGGSRGIGYGIVLDLAKKGVNVVFTYSSNTKNPERIESIINNIESFGVKVSAYCANASSLDDSKKLVDVISKEFGRIDVLVNNVGITDDALFLRLTEEKWDKVIDVNLKSIFSTTKAVVPLMLSQQKGSIINITSVVGICGNSGQTNYAASKAGIIGFTKSLAKELGKRNIRCNAVAPGYIQTDMTNNLSDETVNKILNSSSLKRLGCVEDVAKCVSFLASDDSSFITGQVFRIDGGLSM